MRIVVLGATGHTGRLTVAALRRRGATVLACGRNAEALAAIAREHPDGVETRRVDVTDEADVRAALRGADAVANLAGPFLSTGHAPIRAALAEGIAYADTTGEQAFMHAARVRQHEQAQDANVPVVNALAYEYAMGDLAANAYLHEGGRALHVLYRSRGTRPSAGTSKSILRVMAAPGLGYEDGRLVAESSARHRRVFATADGPRHGMSVPGGEPLTVPQHSPFGTVRTYFAAKPRTATTARLMAPLARVALREPVLRALERRIDRKHRPPSNERARGEVHLLAETDEGTRSVVVHTGDPYATTAETMAEGILRLTRSGAAGVVAPAVALDAPDFLSALEELLPEFSVETRVSAAAMRTVDGAETHK